jgi:hypothetical protein
MFRKTTHMLTVSGVAAAIVALAFAGIQLSNSAAQTGSAGPGNLSGTINSVAQDRNGEKNVIGGEWILSLDGDKVKDFSADLDMAAADGTGSHTHRIVLSDGQTGTASAGEVTVTLLPTEQSAGKTILVNATGLAEKSDVTVKVDDMTAGTPESDEEGNLLYALGITENMTDSVTVTVEDAEGNSGSATLTIGESEAASGSNQTSTASEPASSGNLTGTEGNATAQDTGNATLSGTSNMTTNQSSSNSTVNNTIDIQSYTPPSDSGIDNSNLTTSKEANTTDMGNLTSSTNTNETSTSSMTDNATSTQNESTITAETNGNTTTFKAVADIYSGDEIKWTNVDITVSIINGTVITIEIDPEATDNHFGQEPIYGLVKTGSE